MEHGSLSRTPSSPNSLRHTSLSSFHEATLARGHQSRPGPNPRPPALVTQVPWRVLASQRRQLDPTGSCK